MEDSGWPRPLSLLQYFLMGGVGQRLRFLSACQCHVHLRVIEVDPPTAHEVSVIVLTIQTRFLRVRNLPEVTH